MQHAKKNSMLANSHQLSPPGPREGTVEGGVCENEEAGKHNHIQIQKHKHTHL